MTAVLFNMAIQNRFAPLPRSLHIAFCVIATILFAVIYFKYRNLKDILWLAVCDLTVILQFYGDKTTATVIGVFEVILLVMIYIEYLKECKIKKAKIAAEKASSQSQKPDDGLEDVAKAVKQERAKLAPDSGSDIISQAFDNEDIDK